LILCYYEAMQKRVKKATAPLKGTITVPSDKSISHRAIMFSSLAKGTSLIKNFSDGQDPHSTLRIFEQMGVKFEFLSDNFIKVISNGGLLKSERPLDCGNSGTTMRLVSGILAGQNFNSTLVGDESLSSRPMKRIIEPLTLMGARIESKDNKAPLNIFGQNLIAINYSSKIASAQVKSCILLAGLGVKEGKTVFTEPYLSRNHTEIMLKYMGADINSEGSSVSIAKSELQPIEIDICGDISSAAYFIVAGLIVPNSKIILKNVGLNLTRTGIIEVVKQMGGNLTILDEREVCGERVGDIQVCYSELHGCEIKGDIIPKLIDEIPVIAVLATQAKGKTEISDAQDLRNKESDRISCVVRELKKMGAEIEEKSDGIVIHGACKLNGDCEVETYHDHRLAMSFYVAGLVCEKEIAINGFEWVNISFPNFLSLWQN
jgi:3-phosphoshikimate 1-carboxyvinyltransferase